MVPAAIVTEAGRRPDGLAMIAKCDYCHCCPPPHLLWVARGRWANMLHADENRVSNYNTVTVINREADWVLAVLRVWHWMMPVVLTRWWHSYCHFFSMLAFYSVWLLPQLVIGLASCSKATDQWSLIIALLPSDLDPWPPSLVLYLIRMFTTLPQARNTVRLCLLSKIVHWLSSLRPWPLTTTHCSTVHYSQPDYISH